MHYVGTIFAQKIYLNVFFLTNHERLLSSEDTGLQWSALNRVATKLQFPPGRTGLYLNVSGSLVGLVGHLLLHAGQLLLQVGHLILVQLGEVVQLLLQTLIPERASQHFKVTKHPRRPHVRSCTKCVFSSRDKPATALCDESTLTERKTCIFIRRFRFRFELIPEARRMILEGLSSCF